MQSTRIDSKRRIFLLRYRKKDFWRGLCSFFASEVYAFKKMPSPLLPLFIYSNKDDSTMVPI